MTIKTKYNLGERVRVIKKPQANEAKPCGVTYDVEHGEITGIHIDVSTGGVEILYIQTNQPKGVYASVREEDVIPEIR